MRRYDDSDADPTRAVCDVSVAPGLSDGVMNNVSVRELIKFITRIYRNSNTSEKDLFFTPMFMFNDLVSRITAGHLMTCSSIQKVQLNALTL